MIIKITQTASNIKQTYKIEGEGLFYHGKSGSRSTVEPITLTNDTETLLGTYNFPALINYIPFRYLFGTPNLTRGFDIYRNNVSIGSVVFSQHGFWKSFYQIKLHDGTDLRCYIVGKGSFEYACVYSRSCGEEKQIALIETYLNVNNYKYVNKIYLLDDYKLLGSVISFFTVYYSSYSFCKRYHMSSGSVYEKRMPITKYKDKYDPSWRETYFPDENFFGKISLF